MHILIICDQLLFRELIQNCISDFVASKLKANVDCKSEVPYDNLDEYDHIVIWTHPKDNLDYSRLMEMCPEEKLTHIHFPLEISYWKKYVESSDAWGKPMTIVLREHPEFHTPSKYFRSLYRQIEGFIKNIQ